MSIFLIALIALKQSSYVHAPSPYTVNLVSPDVLKGTKKEKSVSIPADTKKSVVPPAVTKKEIPRGQETIEDKISVLEAKKKIERIVNLRSIVSLKAGNDDSKISSPETSHAKGSLFDDYYSKISSEIRQQWVYPDIGQKDIEAIISIKILKDGTAIVKGIEKSSGNTLFDRSAIRALAKASPLSPPPYEMEIGVRFYP
ncbi:MAG: TonB family protein [Nitrospirae bacterium]|nr:TonB family protein [Nitrospirota bacterium]